MILEFPRGLVIKDLVLSLLWLGFNPWPGAGQKKKKVFFIVIDIILIAGGFLD